MQDQLVSLATARLAKDKGFDWKCLFHYSKWDNNKTPEPNKTRATSLKPILEHPRSDYYTCGDVNVSNLFWNHFNKTVWKDKKAVDSYAIDCPTQSLLQRWLREIHGISIDLNSSHKNYKQSISYFYTIIEYDRPHGGPSNVKNIICMRNGSYQCYEECLELALQEALKLIK